MAFTIVPKDAPAKVEGAIHGSPERPKTPREKAIAAFTGQSADAPAVDPAAAAASNHPGDGQLSPEAFSAIQQKARAAQENASNNQTPSSEAAPATPPKAPASEATETNEGTEQPLNPRFAQLARQEKAIRARAMQLKADQVELQKSKDSLAAREAELQTKYVPKDRLSKETLTVLHEMGIDYNSLTQQELGEAPDPRDVAINELKTQIEALKGEVASTRQSFQDDKTQSYEQAKNQIRHTVSQLVTNDTNYEMIAASDSVSDVVDLIEQTFNEGLDESHPKGTLLTEEEACQIVEDYLATEAEKFARLKKIQQRLAPKTEPAKGQTPPKQDSGVQPQRQPTLTNGMTGAPRKEYNARQRAMFAAQHGPNWQEKVGDKAS